MVAFDPSAAFCPSLWPLNGGLRRVIVRTAPSRRAKLVSRIFVATVDARLIALDAARGTPCPDFGQAGQVDLSRGVDLGKYQVDTREYGVTSPPVVGDLVVVGSAIGDNRAATLERGIVRAFDTRTGAMRWLWDPIPREPADPAFQTWASRERPTHRCGQRLGSTLGGCRSRPCLRTNQQPQPRLLRRRAAGKQFLR